MRLKANYFIFSATDLAHFLACNHLTNLSMKVALGVLKKSYLNDPALEILIKRGQEHEAAYVEHLLHSGKTTINLSGKSFEYTLNAINQGYDVIVQAKLESGNWMGYADILYKVPKKSNLGDFSYEVLDTKLSQNTRPGAILQLCLYSEIIGLLQGTPPEYMHIITPGETFNNESYRFAEFHSYFNLIKRSLEQFTIDPKNTYPDQVEHCNICAWWQVCNKKRHDDDHLSLVAGIRKTHIKELATQGINTLEEFAVAEKVDKPDRGNIDSLIGKQAQAKIQLRGRLENAPILHEMLSVQAEQGLNRLPEPSEGDIYFDIEGDPYYPDGGLEYLFGYVYLSDNQQWVYKKLWARNGREEKDAFRQFVDFALDRLKNYPTFCIYHYAPYEPSALRRLMHKHATCEQEVDMLLRGLRFVDLHSITKETLIASVERYSLKDLEKLPQYVRNVPLQDAGIARRNVECAIELNELSSVPSETVAAVEGYNEDDCRATYALHQWLEKRRQELIESGETINRFQINDGQPTEKTQEEDTLSQQLFESLTSELPEERSVWTEQHKARWLLAHLIEYYRRESKTAWWEYYRVHELIDHEELLDERNAITGLTFVAELPLEGRVRIPTHRYSFPPQEIGIKPDSNIVEIAGEAIGKVIAIDFENRTIDIKKTGKTINVHPSKVHVLGWIDPKPMVESIQHLAKSVIATGLVPDGKYNASIDLLLKNRPRTKSKIPGQLAKPNEDHVQAAIRIALDLDNSVLAIQGPPGSGKTYTGAKVIIALAKAGKRIGVTAVSHKVILNLLTKALEFATEEGMHLPFVHASSNSNEETPTGITIIGKASDQLSALDKNGIVGGTTWLWSREEAGEQLDYLFVDEAGQMSLSNVLAASRSARNLILLGDPQQLEQPQKGTHPEGSDVSALTHLLDGHKTMPEDKGLFLGITRRLNPEICSYTSEIFYEGRLAPLPGLEKQIIDGCTLFKGAGLFYVPVIHDGNQHKSMEEAVTIRTIALNLIQHGQWIDRHDQTKPITPNNILIVAPYNAQVEVLQNTLPGFRVGTVDKFQGQEAAVVIYSMTCSSAEDAPRGMGFLYSPNRFNVATSRALCACILVASPRLMEPECKSIDQMRWANSLCRFKELAVEIVINGKKI
jgi:predicted RecB family nuclease